MLDTGGGLKQAAWFFDDGNPFLVHNVDVLSDIDLGGLLEAHRRSGALATLAVMDRATERPLYFDADGRLVGRGSPGKGNEFVPTPHSMTVSLGFCGIQAVLPAIFGKMSETGAFPLAAAYLRLAGAGNWMAAISAFPSSSMTWPSTIRGCGAKDSSRPYSVS